MLHLPYKEMIFREFGDHCSCIGYFDFDTSLCYSFWFFKIILVILLVVLAFYIPKGHFGQGEKVYKIYLQVICLYYITKKN